MEKEKTDQEKKLEVRTVAYELRQLIPGLKEIKDRIAKESPGKEKVLENHLKYLDQAQKDLDEHSPIISSKKQDGDVPTL